MTIYSCLISQKKLHKNCKGCFVHSKFRAAWSSQPVWAYRLTATSAVRIVILIRFLAPSQFHDLSGLEKGSQKIQEKFKRKIFNVNEVEILTRQVFPARLKSQYKHQGQIFFSKYEFFLKSKWNERPLLSWNNRIKYWAKILKNQIVNWYFSEVSKHFLV